MVWRVLSALPGPSILLLPRPCSKTVVRVSCLGLTIWGSVALPVWPQKRFRFILPVPPTQPAACIGVVLYTSEHKRMRSLPSLQCTRDRPLPASASNCELPETCLNPCADLHRKKVHQRSCADVGGCFEATLTSQEGAQSAVPDGGRLRGCCPGCAAPAPGPPLSAACVASAARLGGPVVSRRLLAPASPSPRPSAAASASPVRPPESAGSAPAIGIAARAAAAAAAAPPAASPPSGALLGGRLPLGVANGAGGSWLAGRLLPAPLLPDDSTPGVAAAAAACSGESCVHVEGGDWRRLWLGPCDWRHRVEAEHQTSKGSVRAAAAPAF